MRTNAPWENLTDLLQRGNDSNFEWGINGAEEAAITSSGRNGSQMAQKVHEKPVINPSNPSEIDD